jgi:hypothetical protein
MRILTKFVGVREAGRMLGLSESAVRGLTDSKQLRAVRSPNGHRLVVRVDVERLATTRVRRGRFGRPVAVVASEDR